MPYAPEIGDFVKIDFDPQAGREQAGRRPAIVLSPRQYNSITRLCVLCPITNQAKGYPFEVKVPEGERVTGVVLSDQVKSLSWTERQAEFLGKAPQGVVDEVKAKVKALLKM